MFLKGKCRFGDKCRYDHPEGSTPAAPAAGSAGEATAKQKPKQKQKLQQLGIPSRQWLLQAQVIALKAQGHLMRTTRLLKELYALMTLPPTWKIVSSCASTAIARWWSHAQRRRVFAKCIHGSTTFNGNNKRKPLQVKISRIDCGYATLAAPTISQNDPRFHKTVSKTSCRQMNPATWTLPMV